MEEPIIINGRVKYRGLDYSLEGLEAMLRLVTRPGVYKSCVNLRVRHSMRVKGRRRSAK